jgi:large repetitive protein
VSLASAFRYGGPVTTEHPHDGVGTQTSPVLPGYYADPNILAIGDRYYVYATTDGYEGWGGTHFEVWESPDLATWTNRGTILTLGTDVSWATQHAWAPAAIERDGKTYFYFTAEQSVGVAVADSPTGPFREMLGRPLVDKRDYGDGQQIEPAVFVDTDGQHYLLWGNTTGYVVPLDDTMAGYDPAEVRVVEGIDDFREALFLVERHGTYYLSWSVDDTRSEDYRVAYATGPSVYGPWTNRGVILAKDLEQGIRGTGHHSILQVPGTDEWFIAYHRFAIPDGDGTHRETTIDRLVFEEDGSIRAVVPTLGGVEPVPVPRLG